jgi:phage-related protein
VAVVGEAYVNIRAVGDKFRGDLAKILLKGAEDAKAGGELLGEEWGQGIGKSFSKNLNKAMSDGVDEANSYLANNLETDLAPIKLNVDTGESRREVDELDDLVQDVVRSVTSGAGGGGGGGAFTWLTRGAESAAATLDILVLTSNILGPLLASLVGAVSALGTSLFALGSAAASAAPALAVLPGLLAAIAQGGIVARLGFSGVGEAISAGTDLLNKQAGAGARSAQASVSNVRAIEAAQRQLRDAYQRAADTAQSSLERIADAERDLADAVNRSRIAQAGLNAARKEAAEQLQQLAFSAEDAVLAQERAGLSLQDAWAELQAIQDLPADNRTRIEAELAFKEADLNYRQAKDRASDLAEEQRVAARAGIEGSREVVDAKNEIAEADQRVIDSQRAVTEAFDDQRRAARDAAEGISDAQRALQLAYQTGQSGATQVATATNKYQQALSDLVPAQREFVKFIVSLNPLLKALKGEIADGLFPPITKALDALLGKTGVGSFFATLKTALGDTGTVIGEFLGGLVDILNNPFFRGVFFEVLNANNAILKELGGAGIAFVKILLLLLRAVAPLTLEFAKWVNSKLTEWVDTLAKNKDLPAFFKRAGDAAKTVGEFLWELGAALKDLGEIAAPIGLALFEAMTGGKGKTPGAEGKKAIEEGPLSGLRLLRTEIAKNKDGIKNFFEGAAKNAGPVFSAISDIAKALLSLGDNPEVGTTFEKLGDLAPTIQRIGDKLVEAGPALADLAAEALRLVDAFTDSSAIETFLNIFKNVFGFIANLLESDAGAWFLGVAGAIFAVTRSVRLLLRTFKFLTTATVGNVASGVRKGVERVAGQKTKDADGNRTGPRAGGLAQTSAGKAVADQTKKATAAARQGGRNIGRALMEGITPGIVAATPAANRAMGRAADLVTKAAKVRWLISSPSKVFTKLGRDLMAGLAIGIRTSTTRAVAAARGAASATSKAATAGVAKGTAAARSGASATGAAASRAVGPIRRLGVTSRISSGGVRALGAAGRGARGGLRLLAVGIRGVGRAITSALGPIGLLFLAIEFLPPLIKKLWEENETFRKVVTKVWEFVQKVFSGALEIIKGVFNWVKENWPLLLAIITGPIGLAVLAITKNWDTIKGAISAVIEWVKTNWPLLLAIITGPIGLAVLAVVRNWDSIKNTFIAVKDRVVETIGNLVENFRTRFENIKTNVGNAFQAIRDRWEAVKNRVLAAVAAVVEFFRTRFENIKTNVGNAFQAIRDRWDTVKQGVVDGVNSIVRFFRELPGRISSAAKNAFKGLYNGFADILNNMIEQWNKFELKIGGAEFKVGGVGVKVPEFTLRTPDIGFRIPRLASGGVVSSTGGGIIAQIAEAGRSERVTPLDSNGFSAAERAMIKILSDAQNSDKSVNVQVFVGTRQIEDIVDVKVNGKSTTDARTDRYSRPAI